MIKVFPIRSRQEQIDELYVKLENNPWCPLKLFEFYMREINILNGKIKNLSADYGRKEGEHDIYIIGI